MRHKFIFNKQEYTVVLNKDGTTVLWKDNKVWGIGVWRCNYVLWEGEQKCTEPKLLDKIDKELRGIVPERLPSFWQKDFYGTVKLSVYQSTLSGVSIL